MGGLFFLLVVLPLISVCIESIAIRSGFLPHNLYECDYTQRGITGVPKVVQKIIHKPGRPNSVIHEAFQYPKVPDLFSPDVITCILVEDLNRNGKGGYAEIAAGGINHNFVELSFESQLGEDIIFSVVIYTKDPYGHATAEP